MQVSKKPKIFWNNFVVLLESTLNFEHFEKKWSSKLKYFWNSWLQKAWLLKCIKGPFSENHLAVNVLIIMSTPLMVHSTQKGFEFS